MKRIDRLATIRPTVHERSRGYELLHGLTGIEDVLEGGEFDLSIGVGDVYGEVDEPLKYLLVTPQGPVERSLVYPSEHGDQILREGQTRRPFVLRSLGYIGVSEPSEDSVFSGMGPAWLDLSMSRETILQRRRYDYTFSLESVAALAIVSRVAGSNGRIQDTNS